MMSPPIFSIPWFVNPTLIFFQTCYIILSRTLIDFLMGETDGVPKDAKYLFRFGNTLLYFLIGDSFCVPNVQKIIFKKYIQKICVDFVLKCRKYFKTNT
jgi:hypothetical protein